MASEKCACTCGCRIYPDMYHNHPGTPCICCDKGICPEHYPKIHLVAKGVTHGD